MIQKNNTKFVKRRVAVASEVDNKCTTESILILQTFNDFPLLSNKPYCVSALQDIILWVKGKLFANNTAKLLQ